MATICAAYLYFGTAITATIGHNFGKRLAASCHQGPGGPDALSSVTGLAGSKARSDAPDFAAISDRV